MKITEKLPQFNEHKSLIVVAGFQSCKFYLAYRGKIAEVRSLHIESPQYSDREGFFEKKKGSDYYISGSVYESKKETYVRKKFLKNVAKNIKEAVEKRDPEHIYVFVPARIAKELREYVHPYQQKLIQKTFRGNFVGTHPFNLLEKMKTHYDKIAERKSIDLTLDKEALKILKKGPDPKNKEK